jgi:hypothetical protein
MSLIALWSREHNLLEVKQNQVHNWRIHIPLPLEAMPCLRQVVRILPRAIWGCAVGGAVSPYTGTIWCCAVACVISHWSVIVDAWVQSNTSHVAIYGHQSGTRTGSPPPRIPDFFSLMSVHQCSVLIHLSTTDAKYNLGRCWHCQMKHSFCSSSYFSSLLSVP